MTHTVVTRTYLQMTTPSALRPARSAEESLAVVQVFDCPPSFYRYLYAEVGTRYRWTDRAAWSDARIREHLAQPVIALWVMYRAGAPAGWFELREHPDRSVEIAYFGLLPEYIGRGLGKHMLSVAVERAWERGPERVWLHTCTLDDRAALPNYLARGFTPFREERYESG